MKINALFINAIFLKAEINEIFKRERERESISQWKYRVINLIIWWMNERKLWGKKKERKMIW